MYSTKKNNKDKKKVVILEKSKKPDKRFKVTMKGFPGMNDHSHEFGAKGGRTFIDCRTEKEKKAWQARHRSDKGYNNKHSGIYYSKNLLWGDSKSLKKNIDSLSKKLDAKIINRT
jgi:formylmethanofuran dehydrogenase subunit A|tara:strand:+ start:272 stop:616 length:345 start_codon:yes stop_codon:yes gene_type:complete